MPAWVSIYCQKSVSGLSPGDLLSGIRGADPTALAGIDYWTLAEDYDVDDTLVEPALAQLRIETVESVPTHYQVHYNAGRPLVVHRWTDPTRVRQELAEAIDAADRPSQPSLQQLLRDTTEVVGIELGFWQLEDMGVVLAYELARYVGQKGDGVICNDQGRWLLVRDGAFVPAV